MTIDDLIHRLTRIRDDRGGNIEVHVTVNGLHFDLDYLQYKEFGECVEIKTQYESYESSLKRHLAQGEQ